MACELARDVDLSDPAELLAALIALPVQKRLELLRAEGEPAVLLRTLGEEIDRMAGTEITSALSASEQLVLVADETGDPAARADMRGARAGALAYAGQFDAALAVVAEAVSLAEDAGLTTAAARSRLAGIHPLAQLARYDEAIGIGQTARDQFIAAGESMLAARADICLGAVFDMQDDHSRALTHYDLAILPFADDPGMIAQIESNRGVALMGLDRFAEAEGAFLAAVDGFGVGELAWAAAIAEGNLAYLATRQGRLERALLHFERARRCLEADESPADLARLLSEQGDAMLQLGMPGDAAHLYEQALPRLEAHALSLEAAQARAGLGRAHLLLGHLDDAEQTLAEAADALDRLGQSVTRARLDLTRSELAARQGRHDEALVLAEDALDTFAGRRVDTAQAQQQLARLAMAAGRSAVAAELIAAALPVAERVDIPQLRASLLHLRGMIKRDSGEHEESLREFAAAVDQVERVRGTLPAERFRSAFLGSQLGMYEDVVLAALDQPEPSAAAIFALIERAKSRALLDVVGGALELVEAATHIASDPAEAALLVDLARVQGELNWWYSRTSDDDDGEKGAAEQSSWPETVQTLETELEAIEVRLAAVRGVAGLYAPPVDLDGVLAYLPAGTVLVEYFFARDELVILVVRDDAVFISRCETPPAVIGEGVRRLRFQVGRAIAGASRPDAPARGERLLHDVRRELSGLYENLIAPVEDRIAGAERLLIVPHGPLHALPFAALWDGGRYLIERHEIVSAPSASVLTQLAVREPLANSSPSLVVGVPDDLAPRIADEAARVAAVLGARLVLGPEATVERVAAAAATAGIVHLACHGRFLSDRPLASGLKLADRWMTVRDVYTLPLHSGLVTLSGCDTGRAAVSGGDELIGLVRAFFAAGASAVMMSLWVTADELTTELMAAFYGAVRRGTTPAAALRDAQCALLALQPHPAFWAPFVLGGHA